MCDSFSNQPTNNTSLIWKTSNSNHKPPVNCSCSISSEGVDSIYRVYQLDRRAQHPCKIDILDQDEEVSYNCSTPLTPYQLLANTSMNITISINVNQPENGDIVWVTIEGKKKPTT